MLMVAAGAIMLMIGFIDVSEFYRYKDAPFVRMYLIKLVFNFNILNRQFSHYMLHYLGDDRGWGQKQEICFFRWHKRKF